MNELLKRIRIVFKNSGKTQTEIGKKLSKTSQYVWKLLNDDSANPSDSVIKDICREFHINEEWLRTGNGDMQENRTRRQEIGAFVNEALTDVDESFKKRLLFALSKLNESDWETLEKIVSELNRED